MYLDLANLVLLILKTRHTYTEIDRVRVIAILNNSKSNKGPSLLLQKQFCPLLDKVTIEVPLGLVDKGEDISTATLRELKEKIEYIATILGDTNTVEGFIMWNDLGFCNTNTKMMFVEVDIANPRNQNPVPELEENEYIETFTLPLDNLWHDLAELDQKGFGSPLLGRITLCRVMELGLGKAYLGARDTCMAAGRTLSVLCIVIAPETRLVGQHSEVTYDASDGILFLLPFPYHRFSIPYHLYNLLDFPTSIM